MIRHVYRRPATAMWFVPRKDSKVSSWLIDLSNVINRRTLMIPTVTGAGDTRRAVVHQIQHTLLSRSAERPTTGTRANLPHSLSLKKISRAPQTQQHQRSRLLPRVFQLQL